MRQKSYMKEEFDYKISVIVPIYRVEKYLDRCIKSIIAQSYTNLQIILVDDGSDDKCPEICDTYAAIDNRIIVIHQNNNGISSARNAGIKNATGDLISFVDPDDYIDCNMYSDMISQYITHNADIVMCDYKYCYSEDIDTEVVQENNNASIILIDGKQSQFQIYDSYIIGVTYSVPWNKLYKKELFEGITYPVGRIHEDESRTFMLFYKAEKIVYIRFPYYHYFQRKDSIVGKKIEKKNIQLLDAYIDKLKFYRTHNEKKLWSFEAMHAIHMALYLKKCFDESDFDLNIIKEKQWKGITEEIKLFAKTGELSVAQKAEAICFIYFPDLLYCIWRKIKS